MNTLIIPSKKAEESITWMSVDIAEMDTMDVQYTQRTATAEKRRIAGIPDMNLTRDFLDHIIRRCMNELAKRGE